MITSTVFAEMQHKSHCWKENHDCSVKAIAILLDISYAKAWYLCRKHGRQYQTGFGMKEIIDIIKTQDKDMVIIEFTGSTVRFLQSYPTGSYLFELSNHIIAYKDGVIHDDTENWTHGNSIVGRIHHLMDKYDA